MRIAAVELFEFRRVLDGRHFNPATRWHERRAPLLRVTTADGLCGFGEGWCDQARIGAFHAHARRSLAALPGQDAREIAELHADLAGLTDPEPWCVAALAAAVDMALWDLAAQRTEKPLWHMLGGRRHVPVYASGGLYADGKTTAALAEEMRGYVARGFNAVKMKIGALLRDQDLSRVAAVRDAVGPGVEIIVDAAGQLDRGLAAAWIPGLAALGVRRIQAPLSATDVAGLAALRDGTMLVLAGEAEFRASALAALAGMVDEVQVNLGLTGFTGALAVPGPLSPQCHATAVLQAASLHFGAHPRVTFVEFHQFHDHLSAVLPAPMRIVTAGAVALDDRPGLGIAADLPEISPELALIATYT